MYLLVVWGLIASLAVANIMLFIMNVPMVRVFASILSIPPWLLVPAIICVSVIGVYSVNATVFDLLMMLGIGLVGYFLRKAGMPLAPLILGVVLGDMMEQNLRRALAISNGDASILFGSPVTIAFWVLSVAVFLGPMLYRRLRSRRQATSTGTDA